MEHGTITAQPSSGAAGTLIRLIVNPDAQYRLKAGSLKYNDGEEHAISGTTFTMPAADVTVNAEFEEAPAGTYTVTIGALSHGIIEAVPQSAVAGTIITLTVTPGAGYRLKAGTLKYNDSTAHAITGATFTMPAADVTVSAEFEEVPAGTYTVTIAALLNGAITASPQSAIAGTTVIPVVTPGAGFLLKAGTLKYNDGTDHAITGITFTMPEANVTVSAEFEEVQANTYTVTIGGLSHGIITAIPQDAMAGTSITLIITPYNGYRLKANTLKYNDGTDHAISGTAFIMPAANVTVRAEFELDTYTVTPGTLSNGAITADPSSAVVGTSITLTITPEAGYQMKAGTLKYHDSTDHAITGTTFIMPDANVTVSAEFELIAAEPTGLGVTARTSSSVSLSWIAVAGADGYRIYRSLSETGVFAEAGSAAITSYMDTGLSSATQYFYKVRAYRNGIGEGVWSSLVSTAIYRAVNITVTPMTDWDLLSQSQGVAKDTTAEFTVTGTYTAYAWYLNGTAAGSGASYTFDASGKKAGAVYELAVVVTNGAGEQRSGRCRITVTN